MLYHSFPRGRENNPSDKGIKIFENILKHGLLLVPEIISYPGKLDDKGKETGKFSLVQCRFCLTASDNIESLVKEQGNSFGDFHLEFTDEKAYEIGAIPVMYVPKAKSENNPNSLWHLASSFIHRLSDLNTITTMLEYFYKASEKFSREDEFTVTSETGLKKEVNIAQLRDILELILEGTVNIHDKKKQEGGEKKDKNEVEFEEIRGAIQGLCSLFYFTDVLEKHNDGKYGYLLYFRQREWRIIQGMSIKGKEQDRYLTDGKEKADILAVDPGFFTRKLDLDFANGRNRRIDLCRILSAINDKPVQSYINLIYVPPDLYEKSRDIATKNNFPIEKIVSYNRGHEISNNLQGVLR